MSNSPRASTHIPTDVIHRPCYLVGHSAAKTRVNALLGPPSSSFPHPREGAERRKALGNIWHLGEGAACFAKHARLPALHLWRLFTSEPSSGEGPVSITHRGHAASAAVVPFPVQPLKADPRSRAGRPPEASRGGDCESQAAGATPCSAN